MLLTAKLGDEFWAEAYAYATYLKNVLPTVALPDGKSPYEHWVGEAPRLEGLHIFGSKVMYLAPKLWTLGQEGCDGCLSWTQP